MMQINLTVTADSPAELHRALSRVLEGMPPETLPEPMPALESTTEGEQSPSTSEDLGNSQAPAKRRGRPRKETKSGDESLEGGAAAATAEPDPEPAAAEEKLTYEGVHAVAKKVNDEKGMQALIGLLRDDFGVQRITNVPEDRWAELVARCEKELAG